MEKQSSDTAEDNQDNSEKLLVLPLGEESKKITQVITNDTARQIMELLAERSMSASDIANQLDVPLTTIKYNIENLVEVGLLKIERIKYSEKGRQVKIYAPVRKLIVVVPEKTDNATIVDVLKKYVGVVLAAIFASGFIELLSGRYFRSFSKIPGYPSSTDFYGPEEEGFVSGSSRDSAIGMVNDTAQKLFSNDTAPAPATEAVQEAIQEAGTIQTPVTTITGPTSFEPVRQAFDTGVSAHMGLWFLLGCLFIIVLIILIDYYRLKKK